MHLEDIKPSASYNRIRRENTQLSTDKTVDLTWEKEPEQLQNKNTTILNTESNHIQLKNTKASVTIQKHKQRTNKIINH